MTKKEILSKLAYCISGYKVEDHKSLLRILDRCYEYVTIGARSAYVNGSDETGTTIKLRPKGCRTYIFDFREAYWYNVKSEYYLCEGEGPDSWRRNLDNFKTAEEYFLYLPSFIRKWEKDNKVDLL